MFDAMSGVTDNFVQIRAKLDELDQLWAEVEPILAAFQRDRTKLRRMLAAADQVDAEFNGSSLASAAALEASANGQRAVLPRTGNFEIRGTMSQTEGIERLLREAAPSPLTREDLLAGLEGLGVSIQSKKPSRRPAMVAQRAQDLIKLGRLPIEQVQPGVFRWTGADQADA
jgi:hypothetical protein